MNDDEIQMLWLYERRLWPLFEIPETPEIRGLQAEVWHDLLDDVPATTVRAALLELSSERFPPPMGLLREKCFALMAKANGIPPVPDVDEAWGEVTEAFGRVGRYAIPSWSHPAVTATVDAIGWVEMCNSTDQGVLRGQFAKLYAACSARTQREAIPAAPAVAAFLDRAGAAIKRVDDVLELARP